MNNNELETYRHSLSHIMAAAIKKLWPKVKLAIGPAVDNGFYYDIDLGKEKITEDDLVKIETEMKKIIKADLPFEKFELTAAKALAREKKSGQVYKLEMIKDLKKDGAKTVSYYKLGEFEDLCRGPHLKSSGEIKQGSWKLDKLAGAYWRGDEKNKMLTRIYGLAFASQRELEDYVKMMAEAEKRDHRKLGQELNLFFFHETAPGMPYWLPKGLEIINGLINFWREEHRKRGYVEIAAPLINKQELYETSGHWEHYREEMFLAPTEEKEIYALKPMNCPNAMIVFGQQSRSYRNLPLRLAAMDVLHRNELSGTLSGLFRVRSFRQDDAHIFLAEDQIKNEYEKILKIAELFYSIFNIEYYFRLSTRPDEFMGEVKVWDKAEKELTQILKASGKKYVIGDKEGAFYGPKIDILMRDSLGREWQTGTIQLDFQIPHRFKLTYTDGKGKEKTPVVIHRVIYGSLERFIGILIEHYAGAFPLWLSPVQVKIISVGSSHIEYCQKLANELRQAGLRPEVDEANETVGNKIRIAIKEKVPYMLVIGDKEIGSDKLNVRDRGETKTREVGKEEFIKEVEDLIKERK